MSQVFISYNKKQSALAKKFKTRVKKAGFTVWMDTELRAGKDWRETIDKEIRRSIAVLVILTPEAIRSQYVTYECAFAYGVGVTVIQAILVEPKRLHPRFDVLQYRDFRQTPSPWKDLVKDLRDAELASRLMIHHAAWGVMDDVTTKLQNCLTNYGINLLVKKELLGNPQSLRGLPKQLCVFYSRNRESRVTRVNEHDNLVIDT